MGLFDFVENFFFIGLALLFVLVLLLVYHFKQRMNSVEKKGDNMYDLLTNVVRELRNIRTNVIGGGSAQQPAALETTQIIPPISSMNTTGYFDIEDGSDEEDSEESDYDDAEETDEETQEDGITYQIIDSFNSVGQKRMVVSDESSKNDTSDEEGSSESDSESDDSDEDNTSQTGSANIPVETYTEDVPLEADEICDVNISREEDVPLNDIDVVYVENPIRESTTNTSSDAVEIFMQLQSETEIETEIETEQLDIQPTEDIQPISRTNGPVNEKLASYKKMNVNQLKALAIQNGIQGDTSKLKKTALIDFLMEKQV